MRIGDSNIIEFKNVLIESHNNALENLKNSLDTLLQTQSKNMNSIIDSYKLNNPTTTKEKHDEGK